MTTTMWMWVLFNVVVLGMLALDLGVLHRKAREVTLREALVWSVVWTVVALLFNAVIWWWRGRDMAMQFLTGYIIERTLSFDNLFVFLLVFSYFRVPGEYQHKVLFWGILGALVMRAVFIVAGIQLITKFHWVIYVFGVLLIVTGVKMLFGDEKKIEPLKNPVLRLFHKFVGTTPDYMGSRFFVRLNGRLLATPLFVVLLFVETTDLVFAVDSIPAILGVSQDGFIVYTSNVFAILGLRALYFALAGIMNLFRFLNVGLAAILVFVGTKMLFDKVYEIPAGLSLGVVCGVLAAAILASIAFPAPVSPAQSPSEITPPPEE
jgi:tellurite resistance protein TerC